MNHFAKIGAAVAMFGALQLAHADSIKVPTHNWSSQLVGAKIVGKLFEKIGEEVEYVPIDSQTVYQSMCENDIGHRARSLAGCIRLGV